MDLPLSFEYSGQIYIAITEANLRNYAGMYLAKKEGISTTMLSPFRGRQPSK